MITRIARKEFTEIWRDGRFRWSAVIMLTLLFAALAIRWQGERNPHSAAHFDVYAAHATRLLRFAT